MTDNTLDNSQDVDTGVDNTGAEDNSQDSSSKGFSQEEVNAIVAKRVSQAQKKYEGVDLDEYRTLKQQQEEAEEAQMFKRQEFDKILKQTKEKSDAEINKLREELTKVRVDGALVNAASKHKATNPDHIAQLLRNSVKLDDSGTPVVYDDKGEVRYNTDIGEPLAIDDLVSEFINVNPYFKSPGKQGTDSMSNTNSTSQEELDLSKLDLTRPEHRKIYEQMVKEGKV
jgi:hypothetical protein